MATFELVQNSNVSSGLLLAPQLDQQREDLEIEESISQGMASARLEKTPSGGAYVLQSRSAAAGAAATGSAPGAGAGAAAAGSSSREASVGSSWGGGGPGAVVPRAPSSSLARMSSGGLSLKPFTIGRKSASVRCASM